MTVNRRILISSIMATTVVATLFALSYKNGWLRDDGDGHSRLEHKVQLWTCSMHPFIVKDKPGLCPICGMELIKKNDASPVSVAETGVSKSQQQDLSDNVFVSGTQRTMANVETVAAKVLPLSKTITAVGVVQYDQSRQAKVTSWIAGRIDKLNVNTVGAVVNREKPVAELYSPELVATQQEYLLAVKSREQLKNSSVPSISESGESLVSSAKERLKLFGVKDNQIAELERAAAPNIRLPIYTPLSGIVIDKMVQEGQYVNVGDVLFNVADLSRVWVEIEIFENEFANLKLGQQVKITSQSYPDKIFAGKISFIYPFLDPKTRTVKARVEMVNHGMKLKPEMFVKAIIEIPIASSIVVPVTAVIDSGKHQTVWVESKPGMFEPREVQVGQREGDKVQILDGIKVGEKVAASGAYLIDSESQLKGVSVTSRAKRAANTNPVSKPVTAPERSNTLKMDDMKM
ncbi:MAG: efflux RND transporter periplasmic adaptor subunit [Desulfuromonadaceae bacterium]|nr:efflux RND transporter periplasmic adaptor subunit [Desulfuromonadaceae bacterium]MDD2854641.1 efflux RND transporter periplasmic adaptor subunit [Desulfuromonadaceae bacterium]